MLASARRIIHRPSQIKGFVDIMILDSDETRQAMRACLEFIDQFSKDYLSQHNLTKVLPALKIEAPSVQLIGDLDDDGAMFVVTIQVSASDEAAQRYREDLTQAIEAQFASDPSAAAQIILEDIVICVDGP